MYNYEPYFTNTRKTGIPGTETLGLESEEAEMIKIGIIGSTGYAGGELARLLLQRDDVEIKWYGSKSYVDQKYASIYLEYVPDC